MEGLNHKYGSKCDQGSVSFVARLIVFFVISTLFPFGLQESLAHNLCIETIGR